MIGKKRRKRSHSCKAKSKFAKTASLPVRTLKESAILSLVRTETFRRSAMLACVEQRFVFSKAGSLSNVEVWFEMCDHFGQQNAINLIGLYDPQFAEMMKSASAASMADFYNSDEWKRVRYKALIKNNGTCQCCGATRATGIVLHVDHIKPRSRFPELALDVDNLQVLCEPCNIGKGAWDETDWREPLVKLIRAGKIVAWRSE